MPLDMKTIRQTFLGALLFLTVTVGFCQDAQAPSAKKDIPIDPQGEWYEVGYMMATEAVPTFRMFKVSDEDLSLRLARVIETLGVDVQGIKVADLRLLQQGWDDAVAGKKQELTFPPEQRGSLVPPALRGFHAFGDTSSNDLADRAAEWRKAVVLVKTDRGHGTGFFIGPGLVVTNQHVIEEADLVEVQHEQKGSVETYEAEVVADQKDVALLKIDWKDNPILKLGDSDNCKELHEIVMIGYPKYARTAATFVTGHISATKGFEDLVKQNPDFKLFKGLDMLQLDIEATWGNSGGPVLNTSGEVIGVLTGGDIDVNFDTQGKRDVLDKRRQFTLAQKMNFLMPFLEKHASGKFGKLP